MGYQKTSKATIKTNARRFACNHCGLVTNAGALGRHQKATGHVAVQMVWVDALGITEAH